MNIEYKAGTLSDFFHSAQETAKEIDEGKRVTPKNIIWIEPEDLRAILKPERTDLVKYLRKKRKVKYSEIMCDMHRTSAGLDNDLKILVKYNLVKILKESDSEYGIQKTIESTFGNDKIEFKVEI